MGIGGGLETSFTGLQSAGAMGAGPVSGSSGSSLVLELAGSLVLWKAAWMLAGARVLSLDHGASRINL